MKKEGDAPLIGNGAALPVVNGQLNWQGDAYSATLTGLLSGTKYDFTLWTPITSGDQEGDFCFFNTNKTTTGTAPVTPPAAPARIMVKVKTSKTVAGNVVNLAWTNSSNNETKFMVQRQDLTGDSPNGWTTIGTVAADVTTYSDTGVLPGNYNYRISAVNATGASGTNLADVGVWPVGTAVAFDGTGDTETNHTTVNDFYVDYQNVSNRVYEAGVPGLIGTPLLITDQQLTDQLQHGLDDVEQLYQSSYYRDNVPFDIVAYSRGCYAALAFAQIVTAKGIVNDARPAISPSFSFSPGLNIAPHLFVYYPGRPVEYFPDKPKVRFMGMISPVGQTGILTELVGLGSWGTVQLNPGWATTVPSGAFVYEAAYNFSLEGGVLPQVSLQTSVPIYVPPGDEHVSIARNPEVEKAIWRIANAQNVPIPLIPSRYPLYRDG
jgi:hypothetical protein